MHARNFEEAFPMKNSVPRDQRHLRGAARTLWREMCVEYELDDPAGLALLRAACEALQRAEGARQLVEQHGILTTDRFGAVRENPAARIERDARQQLLGALRALRL